MAIRWPALVLSVLVHAAIVALAFAPWPDNRKALRVNSVPVTIISEVQQEAPAPAIETSDVAPEEPVATPEPEPVVAPPPPAPAKSEPKPEPKPEPKKADQKKPEPKKPEPKKPEPKTPPKADAKKTPSKSENSALDLDALSKDLSKTAAPKARTAPRAAQGQSASGAGEQNTGPALDALTAKLQRLWSPNCDVPGGDKVIVDVRFTLSPTGRVVSGPVWDDRRIGDPLADAAVARAFSAVKRGEPYLDLPEGLYNQPLIITFNADKACRGR
ncbi:MAG: hypothetical protein ACK41P_04830 [Asticcacaulis sp.]